LNRVSGIQGHGRYARALPNQKLCPFKGCFDRAEVRNCQRVVEKLLCFRGEGFSIS